MTEKHLKLKSYAKINLYLKIGQKLNNDYHNIISIMQSIDLYDDINLQERENKEISIECNNSKIPTNEDSIMYRSAKILMKNIDKGLHISINKRIPIAAGLGGGSSNVAAIMIGINELFQKRLNTTQLKNIARYFGMDTPFFIDRGTALARGKGEIVSPLKLLIPPMYLVLVNPGIDISTKWAYQLFDKSINMDVKASVEILNLINKNECIKLNEIYKIVYNSFYPILSKEYPIIKKIVTRLEELGSIVANITGSGPTVFGVYEKQEDATRAYNIIKKEYPIVFQVQTTKANNIVTK